MNTYKNRTKTLVGLVAALAALAVVAVSAIGAGTPAAVPTDRTLSASLEQHAFQQVDVKPKGDSVGDGWLASGSVREGKSLIGRIEVGSTMLDPKYHAMQQSGTLILADGNVSYTGIAVDKRPKGTSISLEPSVYSIVGGTGAYIGARGTASIATASKSGMKVKIALKFVG